MSTQAGLRNIEEIKLDEREDIPPRVIITTRDRTNVVLNNVYEENLPEEIDRGLANADGSPTYPVTIHHGGVVLTVLRRDAEVMLEELDYRSPHVEEAT